MDIKQFEALLRKAYSEGLTGEEEFELELEAAASPQARALLEQAERDDEKSHLLRDDVTSLSRLWYQSTPLAMAASAVLAVAATLLVTDTLVTNETTPGLANSNVVYLDTVRSGGESTIPMVEVKEPWITLVAYPAFDSFSEFLVRVERLVGTEDQLDVPGAVSWTVVWEGRSGTGGGDSLAVSVKSDELTPGIYRLNVDGLEADGTRSAPAADIVFRVVNPG